MLHSNEIWQIITQHMPRNKWLKLWDIYEIVERHGDLDEDDLKPVVKGYMGENPQLVWGRNVRNVLQRKKLVEIEWDGDGSYLLRGDTYGEDQKELLRLHQNYDRASVKTIFDPDRPFTPQTGSWGLHGIVRVPDTDASYVFFMTYGQSQSGHDFDESISTTGVVTWQSQPRQSLDDKRIQQFIHHDERIDSIHLFLRTSRYKAYTYLGLLRYLDHDSERSRPVWFHWELINGLPDQKTLDEMELRLIETDHDKTTADAKATRHGTKTQGLVETSPPEPKSRSKITRDFRGSKGRDYAEIDSTNRKLGIAGELSVLAYERNRLTKAGRSDLADRVRHTSNVIGDGTGYDIDSFDTSGSHLYIEVKTTRQGKFADFPISPNEIAFSERNPKQFALYRVYDFKPKTASGNFYIIHGDLRQHLDLKPTSYSARLAQTLDKDLAP